jgi:hypothetical protein
MTALDESMKHTIDLVSVTTVFGTIMGVLPEIAALFSIAWSVLRIYETDTVQNIIKKYKDKTNA